MRVKFRTELPVLCQHHSQYRRVAVLVVYRQLETVRPQANTGSKMRAFPIFLTRVAG
jgi:hypothetical protein